MTRTIADEVDHYTLSDDHGADITFDGVLLASTSAWERGKTRWSEYDLYRTTGGNYVAHVIGVSSPDQDWEKYAVHVTEDAADVINVLSTPEMRCSACKTPGRNFCPTCGSSDREFEPTGNRYVPDAVEDLLVEANRHDPAIRTRLIREIA